MNRLPGYVATDHTFRAPLDHADPSGPAIDLFARVIVAPEKAADDLPWLVYLQGGPGAPAPRPLGVDDWLRRALRTHRVVMLDQRGTGRSSPITGRTVQGMAADDLAAHLRLFRADSIVADAEIVRAALTGGAPWETLGQSYGGFITLAYLSKHPEALRACYVTGGIPSPTATPDDVYTRTYDTCAAKNREFYRRYPGDAAIAREIADLLEAGDIRLPDGDRLTPGRFRMLGNAFGMSDGFEKVHWLLERARDPHGLTDAFRYALLAETGMIDAPIWALQEFTYGRPGVVTGWAAERAYAKDPRFAPDADPLLFTGEMMYPWMFREIGALRPFAEAADLLAAYDSWPALADPERLAANEVPLVAAVYADDLYVPSGLQMETLAAIGNARGWLTNEYEHDGLRRDPRVLDRLMAMAAGRC